VRALVRPGSDSAALVAMGVQVVPGDIASAADVLAASTGADAAIHCAAVLGGPSQDRTQHEAVNVGGVINVFEAARSLGLDRVVACSTTTFFDNSTLPLTETSPLDPNPSDDPYTQTKRTAFLEAMRRAEAGEDIVVVIPGGTYGPAPQVARAMEAPSFNLRAVWGIRGDYDEYIAFPVPWSYNEDVAACAVAALDRGVRGERYLAFGHPDDVTSVPDFMNRACIIAGSENRVRGLSGSDLDDPEVQARYGPSLVPLGRRKFPEPFFDNRHTVERLDYHPIRLDDGLTRTIAWLREHDLL
jgi:dihydroflavonol-4-reductase